MRIPDESVEFVYALQDLPHRQITQDGGLCLYHRGQNRDGGGIDAFIFAEDMLPDQSVSMIVRNNTVRFNATLGRDAGAIYVAQVISAVDENVDTTRCGANATGVGGSRRGGRS